MIVYEVGDKVKVKEDSSTLGVRLRKGEEGIIVSLHSGSVEAAFEGLGLVSVTNDLIKKKVRKVERQIKAKNLKLSDEVLLPGTGVYNKIANLYRNDYESDNPSVTIETIGYDATDYGYNDLVEVRR